MKIINFFLMNKKVKNEIIFKNEKYKDFHFIYYFFIIIFILNFQIFFSIRFKYGKSITLLDGNIFIIYQNGIDIYDSTLSNKTANIINETLIEREDDLSKITISRFSEKDYGYIITTLRNTVYIFDWKGYPLYNDTDNILKGEYYTIVPIRRRNYDYIYMIGYIAKPYINYTIFTYNDNYKSNSKIEFSVKYKDKNNNEKNIEYTGLSCELMINSEEKEVIVCFNLLQDISFYFLTQFFIDPYNYSIINNENIANISLKSYIKTIKSAVTFNKKKSLVCFQTDNNPFNCSIYSINNYSFISLNNYYINGCKAGMYSLNVYYMRETEQFLIFCPCDSFIEMVILDKNLENIIYNSSISVGTNLFGISTIYSFLLRNYYLISDTDTNESGKTFLVFGSTINITAIHGPITNITSFIKDNESTDIFTTIISTFNTDIFSTNNLIFSSIPSQLEESDSITYSPSNSITYFPESTSLTTELEPRTS